MINSTQRAILSTLALYAAEGRSALTRGEIYLYLHKSENNAIKPAEKEMSDCLSELKKNHLVFEEGEYYSLDNRAGFAKENIEKAAQSAAKIKKNKWPLIFLRTVPFIRAVVITGSVAMDNAGEKSDLDLLIIVKKGRIWTTRIFALLIIEIFGRRRENFKTTEKICLNFFTAGDMKVPIQNIAMANMLMSAIPLFGGNDYAEFLNKNHWIKKFLYDDADIPTTNKWTPFVARFIEYYLNGRLGDQLEKFFKNWQLKRLQRKITDPQHLDHFILNDNILMLHYPNPKNKKVMREYEEIIKTLLI